MLKRTFLGFGKGACEQCFHVALYPLSPAYRVIYGIVMTYAGVVALSWGVTEKVPLPGGNPFIFGVLSAAALLKDIHVRRAAAKAEPSPGR